MPHLSDDYSARHIRPRYSLAISLKVEPGTERRTAPRARVTQARPAWLHGQRGGDWAGKVDVIQRYEEEMATLLEQPGKRAPSELFGDVSDDLWLWINIEGYRRSSALRALLPALPEEDVQRHWTFRTGDDTLVEGFGIYLLVRDLYHRHVGDVGDAETVLDFGCGYGRVIRYFLRDIDHRRLTGTDYNSSLIDFCRTSTAVCPA